MILPRDFTKYINKRDKSSKTVDIQNKLTNSKLSLKHMKGINHNDSTLTIIMKHADHKIKTDIHNSPWTFELDHRIKHLSFWKITVSQIKQKFTIIID